jgi:hypothetical protein
MKRNFLFLTFLCLTPIYAFGDYVPGRTRASAHADLARVRGDGRYEAVRGVQAVQFVTDGKGTSRFTVSLDARPELPFAVTAIEPNRCGRTYLARYAGNGPGTSLRLEETLPGACNQEGPTTWKISLVTDEGAGHASRLEASGVAEYYLLTQ